MKDYSTLSDREINIAVAERLGYTYLGIKSLPTADGTYHVVSKDGYERPLPDVCNNIVYAWEIIEENKISMVYDFNGLGKWTIGSSFVHNFIAGADPYFDIEIDSSNPLRAAMEVFLMMKEED